MSLSPPPNQLLRFVKIITAVIVIIIFFSIGILVGRSLASADVRTVDRFLKDNELNTESFLIEQSLLETAQDCTFAENRIALLSDQLYDIGIRLSVENAEETLGSTNYNFLKRKYHLLQIKTYTLFHAVKSRCSLPLHVILYYYSHDSNESLEQGHILDQLVAQYPLRVFAISYNYSSELSFLEELYNITSTPSLVLDYNQTFTGLTPAAVLEPLVSDLIPA